MPSIRSMAELYKYKGKVDLQFIIRVISASGKSFFTI